MVITFLPVPIHGTVCALVDAVNANEIKNLVAEIKTNATRMMAGAGRTSVGPTSVISGYVVTRDSHVSGNVQAATYVEDAVKPLVDAMYVKATNDAACAALDEVEAFVKASGIENLVNL